MKNKGMLQKLLAVVTLLIMIQLSCRLFAKPLVEDSNRVEIQATQTDDQVDSPLLFTPVAEFTKRPMVNDNAMGDPNAPIKIEEFSDYQCPFCLRFFNETEAKIMDAYVATGKVYFVYRSFGEFLGPESKAAAEAAYCAGDQDRYWEYHDVLYANQIGENVGAYADDRLEAFAETIQLDMDAFNDCFRSGKYADRADQDYLDGSTAGVTGTPSFVITYLVNGEEKQRMIAGAYPFSEFQNQIDAALAEMGLK